MEDLIHIDQCLSEEEKMMRDSVRRFVEEKAIPLMADACHAGI